MEITDELYKAIMFRMLNDDDVVLAMHIRGKRQLLKLIQEQEQKIIKTEDRPRWSIR